MTLPIRRLVVPLVPLAALLSGCASGGEPAAVVCPQPAIIDGLASVERYRAGGAATGAARDPADLAYAAALQNITGGCRAERNGDLLVNVAVEVVVDAGSALADPALDIPYFVAVSGPNGELLDRRDFVARVVVQPGSRRAGTVESFTQRFAGVGRQGGGGYRVLFGLELPREEALRRREEG